MYHACDSLCFLWWQCIWACFFLNVYLFWIAHGYPIITRKRVGIPLTILTPPHFLCLSQTKTWISNVTLSWSFYVQWFDVRGDCSFCWYWWNCWPSLFILFFSHLCLYKVEIKPYLLEDRRPKSTQQKKKIDCRHILRYWEWTKQRILLYMDISENLTEKHGI